jgi:hypothetical protein
VLLRQSYPSLLVETRRAWRIPNEMRPELHPAVLAASLGIWKKAKPNARFRSITGTYNCIGMVVASRRTWVDPEHLLRILQEDGYRQLASEAETQFGDVVIYRDSAREVSHAGLVVGKNLYDPDNPRDALVVLSKWGHEGEYEHDASDVPPFCGLPAEFWTDRKGGPP